MKRLPSTFSFASAGLVAIGLGAMTLPVEGLSFHPEKGAELAKVFETQIFLEVGDILFELNGQEMDPAMLGLPFDVDQMNIEASMTMRVEDTYVEVGDNRPLDLLRDYVEVSGSYENGFGGSDTTEDDELPGSTVRFKWDDDEEAFVATNDDEDIDEDTLKGLSEDMDLRALLPLEEVEEDDTWQVTWSENLELLLPGFKLDSLDELLAEAEDDEEMPVEIIEAIVGELQGAFGESKLECTHAGTREVDGQRLAVISIASEVDGSMDFLPMLEDAMALSGEEMPGGVDQFDAYISIEVTGELLWDLAGGHFHSLEMQGDISGEMALEATASEQGAEFEIKASLDFSGKFSRSVELE